MDVRIMVETTFEDGETRTRDIGHIHRSHDEVEPENLGLCLEEAKTLLNQ